MWVGRADEERKAPPPVPQRTMGAKMKKRNMRKSRELSLERRYVGKRKPTRTVRLVLVLSWSQAALRASETGS